jgi:hypothetical protein
MFHQMYQEAKVDDLVKRAVFIGWWAKDTYRFKAGTELFKRYAAAPYTEDEIENLKIVKEEYGVEVDLEQIAWYRHEQDPTNPVEDAEYIVEGGQRILEQEYPWHEEEAFMSTGRSFFPQTKIAEAMKAALKFPFKGYRYSMGDDILATIVEPVRTDRACELRVWEDVVEGAEYVVGADPAYGSSDDADRFVVQVFRAYADGLDQVAEYCTTNCQAYQFAWVLCHLCGHYNNARLLLELNGPGEAVFTEMRHVQQLVQSGYLKDAAAELTIRSALGKIRNYMYQRIDSMSGGSSAWHWKTSAQNKITIYTAFRDGFSMGQINIRSVGCLQEMKNVIQEGIQIQGEGSSKDDRPMGCALATRAWTDWTRKTMSSSGRTRENENKRVKGFTQEDLSKAFASALVTDFFQRAYRKAKKQQYATRKNNRWR